MLPSIRLIAATFFCGFIVVFAGLRIAASLNDLHEGLPVMAAHAAPIQAVPGYDQVARRGQAAMPMYDLRFVVSSNSPFAPTLASLAPAAPPLDITPPAIAPVTKEELPAPEGSVLAAAPDTDPAAATAPALSPGEPAAAAPETPAASASTETPSAGPSEP
jgi:hypothetical protein